MNFSRSIYEAKQLVSHGHVCVNGKKVTFCSYEVKNGEIINLTKTGTLLSFPRVWGYNLNLSEIRKNSLKIKNIDNTILKTANLCLKPIPLHLEVQYGQPWKGSLFSGVFVHTPSQKNIIRSFPFQFNMNSVLQFYRN